MDKSKKVADRQQLKLELMRQAAARWDQSVKTGFKTITEKQLPRIQQHSRREEMRSSKGLTKPFDDLIRIEEAQIGTWDAENRPPHSKADLAGRPVARILDGGPDASDRGFGTGFMVSDRLFITNYHVFPDIDYAQECIANFKHEYVNNTLQPGIHFNLDPSAFFINNRDLDFAIVAVDTKSVTGGNNLGELGFIQMIESVGKVIKGDDINIIQYPLGNHKQYACRQNQVTQIFDDRGFIQYITDTAKASSGSPCFNKFWELAALHHCAIPEMINGKIIDVNGQPWNGVDEDTIHWVSNEGISISKIVSFLKANQSSFQTKNPQLLSQLLGTVADPLLTVNENAPRETITLSTNSQTPNDQTMSTYSFHFQGPVTLNFYNQGATAPTPETIIAPPPVTTGQEAGAIVFDEDYESREALGYQEDFLEGYSLLTPFVKDKNTLKDLYREDNEPKLLKYYNYSLVMNKKRRFCHWTAVNVNYDPFVRSNKSRSAFGRDTWRRDPRVPDQLQVIGTELYAPAKRVEQGHIVRREDACWGEGADEQFIEYANSDTFHYTNCTPQLEPFNRANPRASEGYEGIHGIWGALEEHIKKELNNADNKAVIFAGPYLSQQDPQISYVGNGKVKTPMKFWKVVCVRSGEGDLVCFGFWLDQKDVWDQFGPGVEALDFKKFKKQQIRISEITKRTKVQFDEKVYEHDVLINNPFNESAEAALEYNEVKDIQIRPIH